MCDLFMITLRYFIMCTITVAEFKESFWDYVAKGQTEKIQVTHQGRVLFTIVPEKEKLSEEWEQIFGILPEMAMEDEASRE